MTAFHGEDSGDVIRVVERIGRILQGHSLSIHFLNHDEFIRVYRVRYGSIDRRNLYRITGDCTIMAVNIGNSMRLLKSKKQCTPRNLGIYLMLVALHEIAHVKKKFGHCREKFCFMNNDIPVYVKKVPTIVIHACERHKWDVFDQCLQELVSGPGAP